ncbi:toxin-antitoxin system YwqK family antitoxin [Hymenobacter sp. 102]|uniref:toxin-antitoxin system YwqK family antitoxin n=1 Tax=Hymenobacter sp. 102 TaxID=3403152 RepID=UPI003CF78F1C
MQQRGPIGFWSRNRFHAADDKRHGPWREYFDMAEQHPANAGRYRHGLPVGRWRYYHPTGGLERQEQFYRRPPGLLTIRYYHSNGQLARQGQARYRITDANVRFFWFGEWKCYDTAGQPQPSEFYRNGIKTTTSLLTPAGDSAKHPGR